MATALKQGVKTLAALPPSLALNPSLPICLRCLSLRALHTRSSSQSKLLDHVKARSSCPQPRCLPNVHYCRTNQRLNPPKGWGMLPAGLNAMVYDPLQTEIAMATTVEGLFGAIGSNRALLDVTHVCGIIKKLQTVVDLHPITDKQRKMVKLVTDHPEFINLCSIAQSKVAHMSSDELTDMMHSMLKFVDGADVASHPLMRQLFAEGSRRLNALNIQQLAKYAHFVKITHPKMRFVDELGSIAARFSEVLDVLDHSNMQELLSLMTATVYVSSSDLQNRVLLKVTDLLQAAVDGKDVLLTGNDVVRILQYEWHSYREGHYLDLNDLCSQLIQEHKALISTEDLHTASNILIHLKDMTNDYINDISEELLRRLPETTEAQDIGFILELAAYSAGSDSSLKFLIEERVKDLLQKYPNPPIASICIALRRIKYFSSKPLINRLIAQITHSETLTQSDIVHIVEYFRMMPNPPESIREMFESIYNALSKLQSWNVSPHLSVNLFYCISFMPPEILEREDLKLSSYEELLPQLNDRLINLLSFTLKRLKTSINIPEKLSQVQSLLEKVNFQAISNIDQNKSVNHLNSLSKFILHEGGGDVVFLERAMKQYTEKLSQIRNPQIAVRCAHVLNMAGYLHVPLMDKIAEVVTSNIHWVKPSQIVHIIMPFCNLGYHDPPNADQFFQACIDRVIPFLDEVMFENRPNPFYLVALAHYLSYAQRFPEVLLKRIFSLEFLDRFDATLKDMAMQGKTYIVAENRRRMMHLNRTVVLECPELQIPWFHEDYCHMMLQKRSVRLNADQIDLQNVLVEVLGGAQYLRSLAVAPYYTEILFEFVLDSEGNPLPIAEYGSVLNVGKQSSRVMSDLMQWGTQAKTLPKGSQRVSIDYMSPGQYNINSSSVLGGYIVKQRQLEILGYRAIQIPYYEWKSSALPEKADKVQYLQRLLFSNNKVPFSGPIVVLRDEEEQLYHKRGQKMDISKRAVVLQGQKSLGGRDLRVREEDMFEDPTLMRVLKNLTDYTEGKRL